MDTKEQIRQAIDIVDLVGSYVQLRHQGRAFIGLCPWHDDISPSLQVNPERQSFKCWVCDIGGDIFTFVQKIEGVDFREALELLADRAGIALERPRSATGPPTEREGYDKQTLYRAMSWAEAQYHRCLIEAPEAEPARQYLADRGILAASIQTFRIGFAPNRWDWLLQQSNSSSFGTQVLKQVGLVTAKQSASGHYDRFRGRVLFPIRDLQSRPIGLGGRILPVFAVDDAAKYINSPETTLFSKSEHLYGLDIAKATAAKQKEFIVVEGYTDCVVAHQCGVTNTVAVLGTALGERQIRLLRRFAESITLTLDGDEAGQRRTSEILELFVGLQVDLKILTLPRNLDPCDFLIAHGSEAFGLLVADAVDALEHKIRMVTQGLDPSADTHQAHEALEQILSTVAKSPRLGSVTRSSARIREEQILARLARHFLVPEEQLRRRMTELRRRASKRFDQTVNVAQAESVSVAEVDLWDRELLDLILARPEWLNEIAETIRPDDLRSSICRSVYAKCLELAESNITPDFDRLMLESEDPDTSSFLVKLEERCSAKADGDHELQRRQTLDSFRRRKEDAEHRKKIAVLREGQAEQSDEQALNEMFAALRPRHRRTDPTDG